MGMRKPVLAGPCNLIAHSAGGRKVADGWDLDLLADAAIVALAPESVANGLKAEMTAIALDDQGDLLETRLLWRSEDPSVLVQAFRSAASKAFASPRSISPGAETLES
jgi:hypothetical protein